MSNTQIDEETRKRVEEITISIYEYGKGDTSKTPPLLGERQIMNLIEAARESHKGTEGETITKGDTMSTLKLHVHNKYNSPDPKQIPELRQIGWIGQTGAVYALDDQPMDEREKGGFQPLLIQTGTFVYNADNEGYDLREG